MNWEIKKLNECCLSISDGDHFPPPKSESGIPFVTIANVDTFNHFDFTDTMYVPESYYDRLDDKRKARKGDILFTVVGSFGIPILITDNTPFVFQRHIAILRPNPAVIDSRFLYYTMLSKSFYAQADAYAVGAAQRTISLTSLRKMKIAVPDLSIQKKIADVLSSFDNLIDCNNKQKIALEMIADSLYKEWFVRFRFPGYENISLVSSRLGKMPCNFDTIKMNEAFEYCIGGGWGSDEYSREYPERAYVIRGTDFPNVQKGDLTSCPLRYHKKSNYSARELKENDIIIEVSGGTAEQPVGRTLLVTKDVIDRLAGKVICASFCKQIRLNTEVVSPYYFYYWMRFLYNTRIIDRFQLQSTGIINFKFEYFLRKGDVMLPPKDLMDRFDEKVKVLYDEISLLAQQNENLAMQRDLLLPRLMSGKLEV